MTFYIFYSERVYEGIKIAFDKICTTKFSGDPEESKVSAFEIIELKTKIPVDINT